MANAQAGDTVYFRGGQYEVGQSSGSWPPSFAWNPAHSGIAGYPITFKAYPGERPVVNGTVSGANAGTWTGHNENTGVLGAIYRSYITWDGFTVQANNGAKMATVYIMGENGSADNCTIRNFIFNGGTQQVNDGNNWEGLRVEHVKNLTVSNCLFYNYRALQAQHNTSALKFYHDAVGLIEYCEIYNSTVGIYAKSDTDDYVFRNNFIHDCVTLFLMTPDMTGMESDRGTIYNNLLVNASSGGFSDDAGDSSALHGNDWVIANNTFYNAGWACTTKGNEPGHGWKFYNNISSGSKYGLVTNGAHSTLAEVDHNQWGLVFKLFLRYNITNTFYTTLAAWQASTELEDGGHPGVGDLVSDPGFSNGSGTLKLQSDFVLKSASSSRGAGRNGVDMGALNIATTVGYSNSPRESVARPSQVVLRMP
jgi:hypothetical protein